MGDYIDEVRYAIATLVPSLWHESDEEATLHAEFHRHERAKPATASRRPSPWVRKTLMTWASRPRSTGTPTSASTRERHATAAALQEAVRERKVSRPLRQLGSRRSV